VEDSGSGIDPAERPAHFRSVLHHEVAWHGHGAVVENHGGRLSVARNMPYGTIFQVMLPIGVAAGLDAHA
jgi:sensor histidine kinase regulating citrate/malate metabolism